MQILIMIGVGVLTGILAGMFGIGGGVILVPILVLGLGFSQHTANGTSLVALLLPVGILGAFEYFRAGKITIEHVRFGLVIAIGIFFGAYLGSKLALSISSTGIRRAFAVFLGIVALRLWMMKP